MRIAVIVLACLFAGSAQAAVIVPLGRPPAHAANCRNIGCLNNRLNSLTRKFNRLQSTFYKVVGCFKEAPVTTYGDVAGSFGYIFDQGSGQAIDTSALDVTNPGDAIDGWMLLDGCNSTTTAFSRAFSGRIAPAAIGPFLHPRHP